MCYCYLHTAIGGRGLAGWLAGWGCLGWYVAPEGFLCLSALTGTPPERVSQQHLEPGLANITLVLSRFSREWLIRLTLKSYAGQRTPGPN